MKISNSGEGTLLEHLEALRGTLWNCVFAVALMLIPGLYFSSSILQWMIRTVCPPALKLHYFSPFEPLFIQLNIALAAAVAVSGPWILWQIGNFIAPGLYPNEKKTLGAFCFFAFLLSACGIALGFFFVIPKVMLFSLSFATAELQPVIGLGNFLRMVLWMLIGFAMVFELPVALLIPVRAGLLKTRTLKKFRCFFVCGIFLVAALLTPPDVISQLSLGIPGWLLFEITLLFARAVEKKAEAAEEEADEEAEPENTSAPVPAVPKPVSEKARILAKSRKIRKL